METLNSLLSSIKYTRTPSSLMSIINNSSSINFPNCPDWFFKLGLVDDKYSNHTTSSFQRCPDAISVPIIVGFLFGFYILLVLFSIIGFIWKRKSSHIQARTISGMLFTIFSSVSVVTVFSLRHLIGRYSFPCLLISSVFFILPASCSVPNILRSFRIYLQWKVNLIKAQHHSKESETTSKIEIVELQQLNDNNNNHPIIGGEDNIETTCSTIIPTSTATSTTATTLRRTNSFEEVVVEDLVLQSPSSSVSPISITTSSAITTPPLKSARSEISLYNVPNSIILNRGERMVMRAYHAFHSFKFYLALFIICFGIQIVVWFCFGIIEDSYFSNSRFLLKNGSSMLSIQGCINRGSSYVVAAEYCFYLVFQAIGFVLLLLTDKDTYFIKVETILTMVWQFVGMVMYVIMIQDFYELVEYLIPSGMTMLLYGIGEIILTVTLPVIYSIVKDNRKAQVFDSELDWVLNKSETCEMLLEFARRSFCPEGVLFYKDISKFKLTSTLKKRKRLSLQIVNNYLTPGGVYELNLPNIKTIREDILVKINSAKCEEDLPDDLFHLVQVQTLIVVKDVLERMSRQDSKMKRLLEEWRKKNGQSVVSPPQSPRSLPPSSPSSLLNVVV